MHVHAIWNTKKIIVMAVIPPEDKFSTPKAARRPTANTVQTETIISK